MVSHYGCLGFHLFAVRDNKCFYISGPAWFPHTLKDVPFVSRMVQLEMIRNVYIFSLTIKTDLIAHAINLSLALWCKCSYHRFIQQETFLTTLCGDSDVQLCSKDIILNYCFLF